MTAGNVLVGGVVGVGALQGQEGGLYQVEEEGEGTRRKTGEEEKAAAAGEKDSILFSPPFSPRIEDICFLDPPKEEK